ncbi:deoxyribonuclease IV [Paenibacillus urinalis]|uniref:Probable endonuclease 4 n=1 Tax=Paenibacillus urinalis TaxID=521520 RepID=A0AAX3N2R9_9BACL|nr:MULTISPECIES: deoxyribonuclease IV [Paenibacillus]WDH83892.1 deoxyribonuclease IV [Paenibacillus urinalis]WDH95350.1 deoxyribonuclease IV [Paenibacillus urinalis]WDI03545.1 deoxyribonuclease IV [Paenibacillus urinalis]GAK40992.1 endonuclease IV [Paenibacillus sp. TCA20]
MLKIGSHVSFSGKGLLTATEEAASYGSSSFMIYTGAPQNTRRKPMETMFIEEGKQAMLSGGFEDIVVHAPYIINLGSYKDNTYELAVSFLQEEIRRTHAIGVKNIVLHPGAFTDKDAEYGIQRIAEGLNEVLNGVRETDVNIALETMAGKGTEMGRSFEEIAQIIDKVEHNERLTICMDTCHIHDAGYDIVNDLDGVLEQFDRTVGLDRIAVVHINDSKNPTGARKDRHAPIGSGWIGYDTIHRIVHHELLAGRPFILETPWIGKDAKTQRPMYEAEIALLRGNVTERFGEAFWGDVEKLDHFFSGQDIHSRSFILDTWTVLKNDAKAKKADPREPLERLYDLAAGADLFPELSEEALNHRLIAWLAGKEAMVKA